MAYTTVNNPDAVAKVKLYTGTGSENAIIASMAPQTATT